jgi:hypothetical protein
MHSGGKKMLISWVSKKWWIQYKLGFELNTSSFDMPLVRKIFYFFMQNAVFWLYAKIMKKYPKILKKHLKESFYIEVYKNWISAKCSFKTGSARAHWYFLNVQFSSLLFCVTENAIPAIYFARKFCPYLVN